MAKLLLISDLYLGIDPDTVSTANRRLVTLDKACSIAAQHDILLIGGNLFTDHCPTQLVSQTCATLAQLISNDTAVYYSPATHEEQYCSDIEQCGVITLRKDDQPITINTDIPLVLHGGSLLEVNQLKEITCDKTSGYTIGLFHISELKEKHTLSLTPNDLKQMDLTFYAVSGARDFKVYRFNGKVVGAHSGTAESTSTAEQGARYAISLEIDDTFSTKLSRFAINTNTYLEKTVYTNEYKNEQELYDFIKESSDKNCSLHLIITGKNIWEKLNIRSLSNSFFALTIEEVYDPDYDKLFTEYATEDSLRGTFYAALQEGYKKNGFEELDQKFLYDLLIELNKSEQLSKEVICSLYNA